MANVNIRNAGYEKGKTTLSNIDFSIHSGEMVGLIGQNGAGKSTTIAALGKQLPWFEGEVEIVHDRFGYVPEQPLYYEELTLWEHVEFAASFYALENWEQRAEELLLRFRLAKHKQSYLRTFSKGMQQKVMLVIGFLKQHELYVVDEPFVGLDPSAVTQLLQLLNEERSRGAGILLSTHILDTAERWCNRFVMLSEGTVRFKGDLRAFQEETKCVALIDCFSRLEENSDES
ncbi:MAG: ABC transporter ATP-binding protein [Bacilli bacterium]